MRVLFVSHSFPPPNRPLSNIGGMQRVAMDLHAALGEHPGVRLESRLLRTSWRWTAPRTVLFLLTSLWRIPRIAHTSGSDVVLFSSMVTALLSIPLRRRLRALGVRLVTIVHGQDVVLPFRPYQGVVRRAFRALDAVAPVSRATGQACLERGLAPEKLHVVPNGISPDRFGEDRGRSAYTSALEPLAGRLPGDAFLLCSVGRQVERKGFHWFVDAVMPRLPESVHYWLAGDGPMAPAIREAIDRHGLEHRVRLLGRVTDAQLEALYRLGDLFVMPNIPVAGDMEGFGVVMLEAGLCGLPALAARLEGIQDVVSEGVNGHLVESGNAAAFAGLIGRYLADRSALAVLHESARAHTVDTFTWSAVADRFVRLFARL